LVGDRLSSGFSMLHSFKMMTKLDLKPMNRLSDCFIF
jgi:hypothetical protein